MRRNYSKIYTYAAYVNLKVVQLTEGNKFPVESSLPIKKRRGPWVVPFSTFRTTDFPTSLGGLAGLFHGQCGHRRATGDPLLHPPAAFALSLRKDEFCESRLFAAGPAAAVACCL